MRSKTPTGSGRWRFMPLPFHPNTTWSGRPFARVNDQRIVSDPTLLSAAAIGHHPADLCQGAATPAAASPPAISIWNIAKSGEATAKNQHQRRERDWFRCRTSRGAFIVAPSYD